MLQFISQNWGVIFSGLGTVAIAGAVSLIIRSRHRRPDPDRPSQRVTSGLSSQIVQAGRDVSDRRQIGGRENEERRPDQVASAGDESIIVQAGRDAILGIVKSSPKIKLIRLTITEVENGGGHRQKINIILKNNGDRTAFIMDGILVVTGKEEITACNNIGMQYNLSESDWTYDVDLDDGRAQFVGRHSISPNEVVNFDIVLGRSKGGYELTIYRAYIKFNFDEGDELETEPFHLEISGPTVMNGGYQSRGPTPEQWGKCMADNIRRLDCIGYDFRPFVDVDSAQYIEAVAPGLMTRKKIRQ